MVGEGVTGGGNRWWVGVVTMGDRHTKLLNACVIAASKVLHKLVYL